MLTKRQIWTAVVVLAGIAVMSIGLALALAQRPRTVSRQSIPSNPESSGTGKSVNVRRGGNLQAALNAAQPGDRLILEAGAIFVGTFTLPVKNGSEYITIESSQSNQLPEGRRVNPAQAPLMAKVQTNGVEPAMQTAVEAHHYKFVGIEFTTGDARKLNYGVVKLGDGDTSGPQNTAQAVPHHLIFDRCYIHGLPGQNVQRGVALNSSETTIINCYISEIHWADSDAQAVGGWNGPGPFKIVNNYLEASGENLMFGGAIPAIRDLIPSDIEIRGNHFNKPLSWKPGDPSFQGRTWSVKNLLELKSARRVLIEGNVFENNWPGSQAGFAILFTVANDSGEWAQIEDIQFVNNLLLNLVNGVNIRGRDNSASSGLRRLLIRNNLFESVNGDGGQGILFQVLRGPVDLTIDHNTAFNSGTTVLFDMSTTAERAQNFTYTNNIAAHGTYGVFGSGGALGTAALNQFTQRGAFKRNIFTDVPADISSDRYPPENFFVRSARDVKFLDIAGGNFELAATSKFKARGTNGSDIGCDLPTLRSAVEWFKGLR